MTLPLPYVIDDDAIRANFDEIAKAWPAPPVLVKIAVGTGPAFAGAWGNISAPQAAGFYRVGNIVYLEGVVTGGVIGGAIFTLPVGYRPPGQRNFPVMSNVVVGQCIVTAAGVVQSIAGNTSDFALDGILFRAA